MYCIQRRGLAFRATRPQEYIACVQSQTIRPRHWPSNISVRESIEAGSRRACLDPYIHLTTDITVAAYYASPGSPILVFDMAALQSFCDNNTFINLNDNVTRAQHLPAGSFSDTWSIQSREILIDAPDLPFTTPQGIPLVIGVIDSQRARLLSSHPHSAADILSCLTPEAVIFLSAQLETFWSRCS